MTFILYLRCMQQGQTACPYTWTWVPINHCTIMICSNPYKVHEGHSISKCMLFRSLSRNQRYDYTCHHVMNWAGILPFFVVWGLCTVSVLAHEESLWPTYCSKHLKVTVCTEGARAIHESPCWWMSLWCPELSWAVCPHPLRVGFHCPAVFSVLVDCSRQPARNEAGTVVCNTQKPTRHRAQELELGVHVSQRSSPDSCYDTQPSLHTCSSSPW